MSVNLQQTFVFQKQISDSQFQFEEKKKLATLGWSRLLTLSQE